MSVIMMSPMIHNQVEWGRALPAMPGKVLTGKIYFEGNKAKNDPAVMREAIRGGLVPIGHRGYSQDITSVPELPNLAPGRSLTSKVLSAVPGLFSRSAGDAVKKAVDKAGDFWHNKLLWDRIGDLQMGLYTNLRDHLLKKGFDPLTSQRAAAHWANRYAGAIPLEAMSASARKIANLLMFSRSFTLGNLGVMKDSYSGLPRDVQAQIARDSGMEALNKIKGVARRKATAVVLIDMALFYAGNSLLQSAFNTMGAGQTMGTLGGALGGAMAGSLVGGPLGALGGAAAGSYAGYNLTTPGGYRTMQEEIDKYKERFGKMLKATKENPLKVLEVSKILEGLGSTAENEPGKQGRVFFGVDKDGTALYTRLAPGKIGEEFIGYQTGPIDMMHRKLGTWSKALSEIWSNDKGFGRPIYYKNAETGEENLKNVYRIGRHLLQAQLPVDWIKSMADWESGSGDQKVNMLKTISPLLGATISKGAPEGPPTGIMFRQGEKQKFDWEMNKDDVRKLIKDGKFQEASDIMSSLKMDGKAQAHYFTIYSGGMMNKSKIQRFYRGASPEQSEAMDAAFERQKRMQDLQKTPSSPFDLGATPRP